MPTNKQRREAARRHLERQLQARQEREATQKRRTLIATIAGTLVLAVVIVLVVVLATSGNGGKKGNAAASTAPSPTAPAASTSPAAAKYPCTWTKSGEAARKVTVPSTTTPPKAGKVVVDVGTTRGAMVFTLDRSLAPCTVASFESLVKQKFYDNTPCPRVESKSLYILQCGDPTGTTSGGPGYTIPDEYRGSEKYTSGVLAMANTGQPNSGGSQFFIVYKDDPLPPSYTIFGKVTSGLDVVEKVAAAGDDGSNQAGGGKPKLPISFTTLTVKSG